MSFVSVIIPIYNVEKYLVQCIDSIINQTFRDIEVILVDDGSTDNSPKICDEYAAKDSRIKVIHKENGGSSSARNVGIDIATGRYIMFMDSDDWWNPDVDVAKMFEQINANPDIEMFLFTSLDYIEGKGYFKRKEHYNLDKIRTDTVVDYYNGLLQNGNLEVHAATKIFRADFIKKNELLFKFGIKGEDNEWMIRVLRHLQKVSIINEPLYIYRAGREGSITNSVGKANIIDLLNIVKASLDYCNSNYIAVKSQELCFCSYLWFTALGLAYNLNKFEKREIKVLYKETQSVCKFSNSPKTKVCRFLYIIMGLDIASFVLGTYIKLKNKRMINKCKVK